MRDIQPPLLEKRSEEGTTPTENTDGRILGGASEREQEVTIRWRKGSSMSRHHCVGDQNRSVTESVDILLARPLARSLVRLSLIALLHSICRSSNLSLLKDLERFRS